MWAASGPARAGLDSRLMVADDRECDLLAGLKVLLIGGRASGRQARRERLAATIVVADRSHRILENASHLMLIARDGHPVRSWPAILDDAKASTSAHATGDLHHGATHTKPDSFCSYGQTERDGLRR